MEIRHFYRYDLLLAIAASARDLRYYMPVTQAARRLNFTLSIVLLSGNLELK